MERIYSCNVKICDTSRIELSNSFLYKTDESDLFLVFNKTLPVLEKEKLEEKLSNPRPIKGVMVPKKLVYVHDNLIGYIMDGVDGTLDSEYEKNLSSDKKNDLDRIAKKYLALEKIVKEAGEDIVFPKLLDNTVFVDKDGKPHIIGYEGIQVGDEVTKEIPKVLHGMSERVTKYGEHGHYTKELDKLSLVHYYLGLIFGDYTKTSSSALKFFGLDDDIIDQFIEADNDRVMQEYLGDRVKEMASTYKIITERKPGTKPNSDELIKRLVLKNEQDNSNK